MESKVRNTGFSFQWKGIVSEFKLQKGEDPNGGTYQWESMYTNGLLGVIFTFGVLYTSLKTRKARSWWYATGLSRTFEKLGSCY